MRVTFAGAAKTVTGSCFLVETDNTSFIIDCGIHQGKSEETALNRLPFPFSISDIDFMLLTHAHIDHSGRIPRLYKEGFDKPIYTTRATAQLCEIMLPDSGHIQEMEAEWQKKKKKRAGGPIEEPMYTMQDAIESCKLFSTVSYDQEFSPASDVRVVMRDAGHILGSAILEIFIKENNDKEIKVVFSGDLGNRNIPIMRDPAIIDGADYLIIESTYGDRLHQVNGDSIESFVRIIEETIEKGGNVVIPSFAVGRTQEVIYELNKEEEKYRDHRTKFMSTPVYVDSPMAISATKVFRDNTDCFDEEAKEYIRNGDNPLDFENLNFTETAMESRALNTDEQSKIIISASGMCDAGRIKHHLKHNLWRKDSTVIFVGYQAVGTLGRRIVDGAKKVRIFDEEIAVNATIKNIEGFSGHADRDGLLQWISAMDKKPAKIILVHGDEEVIESFKKTIEDNFGIDTYIPSLDETVELGNIVTKQAMAVVRKIAPTAEATDLISWGLDDLQSKLDELTVRCKRDLNGVASKEDRKKILSRYQSMIQKLTEVAFAKMD
jgi:metallo-beta-lactamase family protein